MASLIFILRETRNEQRSSVAEFEGSKKAKLISLGFLQPIDTELLRFWTFSHNEILKLSINN